MIIWKYLDAEVYPSFNDLENVIITVSWICELVKNGNVVFMEGKTGLETENLRLSDYIEFNSLTYEIIDFWVKQKMGLETVKEIEQSLYKKLDDIINPKVKNIQFSFNNETVVTEPVIIDTSDEDPGYSIRELNALGIGTN